MEASVLCFLEPGYDIQVLLSPIELGLLLLQHLIEAKRVFSMSGVSRHLLKALFPSSLGLGPLRVEVGTDLAKGYL
jgi:hypothetical protein